MAGPDFNPDEAYFARLVEPFGERSIDLLIGPIRVRLEGLSAEQTGLLTDRFSPFVRREQAIGERDTALRIALRRAGVGRFLATSGSGSEIYRMVRRTLGERRALWSYEFAGWVEPARGRATLALVQPSGELFERGLENFLRVMTATYILNHGGLLLHASGIVRRNAAYVFFGPSGSGKTTVTHLSPRDTILSDDLTLIVPSGEGYAAAGIPFGMAHHRTPQTNTAFPIASLNRLVQSSEVRKEPIEGARAIAELAGSLPFVMQERSQASCALDTAHRVLDAVPAYRLHFRRDDTFWNIVAGG